MIYNLSINQLRQLRLRSQRLYSPTAHKTGVGQLVKEVCALQAQDTSAVPLAVRARTHGLSIHDVRHALEIERSIVLMWFMRGTMHLVSVDDLGWMLPFFGPMFIQKTERRFRQLRLDPEIRARATYIIRATLSKRGALTRKQLKEVLAQAGLPVKGQGIAHLLRGAALEGTICFGPMQEGELTYVLLDDWVQVNKDFNLNAVPSELARRYLNAYAPSTPADLANWAGMSLKIAQEGFASIVDDLFEVKIGSDSAWMLKSQITWLDDLHDKRVIRFLPNYDSYLLGYRSRDFMVPEQYAQHIRPGGGLIRSTVVVDGQAVAIWKRQPRKHHLKVIVQAYEPIQEDLVADLEAEAKDIGRFLHQDAELHIEDL